MDHSIEEAMQIQKSFEEEVLPQSPGILGVGIGLNSDESDFALSVQVATEDSKVHIPEHFKGLDVVVDIVGKIEAF